MATASYTTIWDVTAGHQRVTNQMDAHELLIRGLVAGALLHLVGMVTFIEQRDALQKTIGLSARTLQRL